MRKVRLIKIKELEDAHRPNNIEVNFSTEGILMFEPVVGQSVFINEDSKHMFATSKVTEVINKCVFKTLNSMYKIENI